MKLLKMLVPALVLAGAAMPAQSASLDLNLNDDAVRGEFSGALSSLFSTNAEGQYQLGALYSDDKNLDLKQIHAGLLATGDTGAQELRATAGLGVRAQYLDADGGDGGGLALGGQFDIRLAGFERLGLQGYFWYSPKVLTFGDIEDQTEWSLSADYQVLRNASVYVGYRQLRIDPENGHAFDADDGFHLGFRFKF